MTSALKRSYPFGSRPPSLVEEANHQFKVPQIPVHKKMSVASPSINVSTENASNTSSPFSCMSSTMSPSVSSLVPSSMSSWRLNNNKASVRQDTSISSIIVPDNNDPVTQINVEKSPLPSPPSSKGRRNMKNLQLVVPPVRSAISAPSSPQLPQMSSTHTHNRRPSTPICIFQNKNLDGSNTTADPMALMSKTENAIGEDLPYKDEPILILPNLYLGSELNAANRTMLNRLNIEFILNVGKEVENPYLDEIIKQNSPNNDNENSPCSSDCSDDSFKTAIQSPLNAFKDLDSPMASPSLFGGSSGFNSNSIQKRSSMSRPTSISLQLAKNSMQSGVPLIVPSTSEFNSIKYKKFFWTHNQENLISDFSSAFSFIDEARLSNRNILVHCQCGVSRSASLIIGYVMEANKLTLNQAYEFVKDRSPYISPNMSLVYQLVDFEKILKLGSKNLNNVLPGTPTKTTNRPTHSRTPSIESDLLLKTHRRSSSISRNNPVLSIIPVQSSSESLSSPKTPTVSEGGTTNLSQQSTVKGGPGRFHVITASTTSVTPSTLSPASSVSPTSTASPTTPSSEQSSPTTRLRLSSRSSTLSPEINHSSLTVNSKITTSTRSRSPYSLDRVPLSPKEITNIKTSTKPIGPTSGIFSKSTMESIFSPTRTSPPITPVTIPNVFLDDE